jgi:hypothetical protein
MSLFSRGRLPERVSRTTTPRGRAAAVSAPMPRATPSAIDRSLITLSGILGEKVLDADDRSIGRLDDVVVRWPRDSVYPHVVSIVVRSGRTRFAVSSRWLTAQAPATVTLKSSAAYARDSGRRPGEIALAADVLDRQLFDAQGREVLRPGDLYLATVGGGVELVGVETGLAPLARRLGLRRFRRRPRPARVIDWADVGEFVTVRPFEVPVRGRASALAGRAGTGIALTPRGDALRTLRSADVEAELRARLGPSPGSGDAS